MELDNMKQMWQKLDESIERQNTINERLIRNMIYERTGNVLRMLTNTEHLGLIFGVLLMVFLILQAPKMTSSTSVLISYIFTLLIGLASIIFSWYKVQLLSKLDMLETPVTELAEKTEKFRMLIVKERFAFILLGPVLIATFFIVMTNIVNGFDILNHPDLFWPKAIIGTVVYIVILLGVYNRLYFKNIKAIRKSLDDIRAFQDT